MWIFNRAGFFSAVRSAVGNGYVITVRARARGDLDRFRELYAPELGVTVATPHRDYPYRAVITHEGLARALSASARDIDYPNFKSMVLAEQGAARERHYHDVWSVMFRLEARDSSAALAGLRSEEEEGALRWNAALTASPPKKRGKRGKRGKR